jgi:hypothetical protein
MSTTLMRRLPLCPPMTRECGSYRFTERKYLQFRYQARSEEHSVSVALVAMPKPASYVQPIHFDDFGGFQFERLVFAYHWRTGDWRSFEWYGQAGSDLGRDIWGARENETQQQETVFAERFKRFWFQPALRR